MKEEVATKEELVADIEAEWKALTDLIASVDEAEMETSNLENGWSVKDTLAHVMSWEQKLIEWAGELVAEREPQRPFSGDDWVDRVNDQVYNEYRQVPLAEVEEAFQRSHEEAMALVNGLDEAVLFDRGRFPWLQGAPLWRMVAANTNWHYHEHRELIADSLGSG